MDADPKRPRRFSLFVIATVVFCLLALMAVVTWLAIGAAIGLKSPILAVLTVAFFVTASITTFDKRLTQARKRGELASDEPSLPGWVAGLYWIEIGLKVTLFILNWRYGLLVYIAGFVLSVLPVLETLGNLLMRPFKPRPVSEIERLAEGFLTEHADLVQTAFQNVERDAQLAEVQNSINRICERWTNFEYFKMPRDAQMEAYRREVDQFAAGETNLAQRDLLLALGGYLINDIFS